MSYTLSSEIEIVIEECIECGAKFGMTKTMHTYKKNNKKTFYCPNGHSMSYTKSEEERLREQLEQKDRTIAFLRQQETNRLAELARKREAKRKKKK